MGNGKVDGVVTLGGQTEGQDPRMYNGYMTMFKLCQGKKEWDEYILENDGHPLQLWGWGDLKVAHGWRAYRLYYYDNSEKVVGAAQLLIRSLPWPFRSLAYVPRGPVAEENSREELLSDLANYVKRTYHSVVLTIEPDSIEYTIPKSWKRAKNHILPARTIMLDLSRPESDLLNDMAKKTRQYIRKSASEAINIKMVRSKAELDKCLKIYRDTAKRAKFRLHSNQYYHDVFDKLADYSQVFAAYIDDQPIAFLWIAISASTAFELYGGMDDLGQQLRSNYALKWHVIRKCKEWGISRYDFGGMLEGGITTFKRGWAKNEIELAGTFDRPLSASYSVWNRSLPVGKSIVRKLKRR